MQRSRRGKFCVADVVVWVGGWAGHQLLSEPVQKMMDDGMTVALSRGVRENIAPVTKRTRGAEKKQHSYDDRRHATAAPNNQTIVAIAMPTDETGDNFLESLFTKQAWYRQDR